jgi:hypothetical protein
MTKSALAIAFVLFIVLPLHAQDTPDAQPKEAPPITVGLLVYDQDKPPECVGTLFLDMFNWQTDRPINKKLQSVPLAAEPLPDLPLMFLTGDGAFALTDEQSKTLGEYLQRGGTIIASSSCASAPWNSSFVASLPCIVPDAVLREMSLEHPIFNLLFKIDQVRAGYEKTDRRIAKVLIDGRVAIIFAPGGLNDTSKAGKDGWGIDCCCCGADELRDAHLINANILAWVLRPR